MMKNSGDESKVSSGEKRETTVRELGYPYVDIAIQELRELQTRPDEHLAMFVGDDRRRGERYFLETHSHVQAHLSEEVPRTETVHALAIHAHIQRALDEKPNVVLRRVLLKELSFGNVVPKVSDL